MTGQNPFGLQTVTPYLVIHDVAGVIQFVQEIFGAELRGDPTYRDDGTIQHAEVKIGDSVVMMGEPMGEFVPMPATLYTYVDDCDATYAAALAAGAESVLEPADHPHRDRYGGVRDNSGNIWWVVTHIGGMDSGG